MSFAGSFQAIAARYGQTVTLWRDGSGSIGGPFWSGRREM